MKIVLLSSGSGSQGGGEIYLQRLAEGLLRDGHEIHAVVPKNSRMDALASGFPSQVQVHRPALTATYDRPFRCLQAVIDVVQQRKVAALLRNLGPDVVHVNQQVAEDGLDLLAGARRSGLPFLSTIHVARSATALGARYGRLRDFVARSAIARAAGIHITVADRARRELLGWLRPDNFESIVRVWNGVGEQTPFDLSEARQMVRREWGTAEDVLVVGGIGRLQPQKDPEFALRVAAELKARGKPIHFVWIGDGPLKQALLRLGAEIGMSDKMTIDGWRNDAAGRVAGLDLLLMPSRFEGLPLALLEAMHAGVPVMARDVDGIAEAIVNGVSGMLCSGVTATDWCDQLEATAPTEAERRRLGCAARERARRHFSVATMTMATEAVYRRAIDQLRPFDGCAGESARSHRTG